MKKILFISIFIIAFQFQNVVFAAPVKPATGEGGTVSITNPLQKGTDGKDITVQQLIGKVIKAVLGISGSLALLMFVYGGFTWMLSGGNSEKVTKGKNTLVWAAIGLIVIFSSYALVNAIFTGLAGA